MWDVQEKGPAAVNDLDRLRRAHPGLFERGWIRFVASAFLEAGMMPQALALFESDLRDHPQSGRAAVMVAEACVKTGDRARLLTSARSWEVCLEGAHRGALLYSLVRGCRVIGVPPFPYLRDALLRVATHPRTQIHQLTAKGWLATFGVELPPSAHGARRP